MVDGRKHKKKKHLSSATKVSSPAIAEANGTKRFAELDSNMSNPSKRKRESEPERKRKSKKHRKSEKFVAESASPENNASPSASAIQIPPTPSQPTSSKIKPKSKSSTKKVRKQNGEDLTTPVSSIPESTPELTAAEEPLAVKQLAATKQPQALDSPNPEGSTTPGFRAKRVRGSRTREKDNLKIGFYTPDEVRKIEAYKLNFCTMHGIASAKFDEMVQHSERGANGEFPLSSDIISKSNFWNEIYALVPDRDRRSVYRFMRRHFQTSAQKAHDWSKEQEDELIELHTKYGPKWTFIGKLIGRSDDDVTQRWKNKLEHQGTMNQGAWLEEETRLFLSVVESTWLTMKPLLADNSGKDMYELDERLIVWGNVSKEMGYMRSRQQCADKWRKIVKQVMMMRANGHPGAVFDPKLAAKKSAIWNRRLEAQRKSSQFVNEDSDEDETTKTTNPKLKLSGEVAPSTIANANFESDEGELELPEPSKKAKKSKSKRKHNENPASGPIKEAPLSPATPKKSKEERKREKMERRKKGEQENIEQEAQEDKAARKDRKRKRKEEKKKKKKKQKRLEEEERLAAEAANKAPSSDAEAPEPPKRKKSKKQKQSSSDSPAPLDELSHPMVESSLPTASPASRQSGIEQDAVVDETDLDGGDNDSSEVNVKYETDSDEL
ncbi:hypothetical protein PDIG_66500 [Penicillium digitatum PHI26]|uniref:MYB DNA-binding domain protein n=3 Tax=Penicillium digitatum TaxID=36651 RepID=K9G697_PEND2|nr:hypothetical protein PDIP_75800 [Penicillium digitatum Pd1]EKV06878.1 hypothetical protein PDIP_75800 [Penicillium digitatum Pd1]EKV08786.1 hypothetical protein PDIG_66500 [Penicillium digitatum PHI26]